MGLLIENNQILLTDASGNARFSTAKRMPHLILPATGTINVPNCRGSSRYVAGVGYAGEPYATWSGTDVNYTQDFLVLNDPKISEPNSFVIPFFKIVNGMNDTGGAVLTGSGSVILRLFVDGVGYYKGVSTLTPLVIGSTLILRVRTTILDSAGGLVDHTPISLLANPVVNNPTPVELANTNYTINYRLYYGKFS
jgi:hypothetical protein